jgi:hypothetical protein
MCNSYHLDISLFLPLQSRHLTFSELARNPQAFYFRQQTSSATYLEFLMHNRISFGTWIHILLSSNSQLTLLRISPFSHLTGSLVHILFPSLPTLQKLPDYATHVELTVGNSELDMCCVVRELPKRGKAQEKPPVNVRASEMAPVSHRFL